MKNVKYIVDNCNICKKEGVIKCPNCNGEGIKERNICKYCDGVGIIICKKCNGETFLIKGGKYE